MLMLLLMLQQILGSNNKNFQSIASSNIFFSMFFSTIFAGDHLKDFKIRKLKSGFHRKTKKIVETLRMTIGIFMFLKYIKRKYSEAPPGLRDLPLPP